MTDIMTEKEQIIKDFLDYYDDMYEFTVENPELEDIKFKNIITFLNKIQLDDDDNVYDVEHMFLHWIQGQYLYTKTKAEAIVSILQDFKDHYNKKDNNLIKEDFYLHSPIHSYNKIQIFEFHIINKNIESMVEITITFA